MKFIHLLLSNLIGQNVQAMVQVTITALTAQSSGAQGKRRHVCCGKPLSTELDQKVYEFLEEERSQGRAVSNEVLKLRALQVAGGLRIEGFKASCGWLE